nr:unnamed protein product [Digitaria exilis]CAB3502771.1 unnamed protein product [Digitaria exilis]
MDPPLPPPPPATTNATWLILDRFVHYSRRRRGVIGGDATTSSLAEDCAGRHVRVSLRIADPPAISRLYLHWPGRPHTDLPFSKPIAIAAHRSSILFRMTVPFDDNTWWHDTPSFPVEHFVYSSPSSPSSLSPPSLISLPPCFYGGDVDPVLDKFFRQHRRQRQRIMFNAEMGILCHGGDSFTISPDMKIDLDSWRTDVVVPIGTSLCWVDYYQGMLLVDVLGDHRQVHGIRLPAQALNKCRRRYNDAGDPDPFRHVGGTDDGIIKLVCVFVKDPPSGDDFKIVTWTLVDIGKGTWRKDVDTIMRADEFFGVIYSSAAQSCLPRVQPSFPVMSLVDPDVICFLLIKEEDCNRTWMVEVNMRCKLLLSSALYINEEEEEGHPSEKDCTKGFYGHYFIPTNFSSYSSKDAITR